MHSVKSIVSKFANVSKYKVKERDMYNILFTFSCSFFDNVNSASDFYMHMGRLIQQLMTDEFIAVQKLLEVIQTQKSNLVLVLNL